MSIRVVSVGLRKLITDMDTYVATLNTEIGAVLTNEATEVENHAKQNHRYKTQTGNLERSTYGKYDGKRAGNGIHVVTFGIDDSILSVDDKESYGTYIHEGTYQGYSRSKIAPKYSHSISKSGKGWKADPFLWNAIQKKWNPSEKLRRMNEKLKRRFSRV